MGYAGAHRTSRLRKHALARPPIDPAMLDCWVSDDGSVALSSGAADTWKGGKAGLTFTFDTTRPTYAADSTNFNGRSVVQCSSSGTACMRFVSGSTLLASGTRPMLYAVMRARTVIGSGGEHRLVGSGVDASSNQIGVWDDSGFPSNRYARAAANNINGTAPPNTTQNRFMVWADGTNGNLKVGTASFTVADTASLSVNVNTLSVGCNSQSPGQRSDASLAFLAWFTSKPSDAYLAKLDNWVARRYGV